MEAQSRGMNSNDRRVGLIYSERMCGHYATDEGNHPECPDRIRAIWAELNSHGLLQRSIILNAKVAADYHIGLVHEQGHINLIKNISSRPIQSRRRIANSFNSIYFSEGSTESAYLAGGSVIEVADKVAKGELDSAFAVVRPPGHHAEMDKPMGFCLYNNVGIAASFLLNERMDLGIRKILIVDWDVHHGNGTQKMFYDDPRVLFFSVHRHNFGHFYPVGNDGSYIKTGAGPGVGFNINVPWEHGGCGDADYLAVWNYILLPVAKEFNPDIILISAGFDAAVNDPIGGCCVTPVGYAIMLKKLMESVGGKIVMALEGGYNLVSLAKSVQKCVGVLLGDMPDMKSSGDEPYGSTWRVIEQVRHALSTYWPILASRLPEEVIRRTTKTYIPSSDSDSECETGPPTPTAFQEGETVEDVIQTLSSLEINQVTQDQASAGVPSLGVELQNVYVWYASFGSNMRTDRFLCYIEGGQIEEMKRPCVGSKDKSKPKEIIWKTFPHRLFFARDGTATWGPGGVAFLHPQSNANEKAFMCLYKITLEQFNDVLLQENGLSYKTSPPIFDRTTLQKIQSEQSIFMETLQGGWYRNVVYLGVEKDIPILTMTCTLSDIEIFKSGNVPINPPCKEYANTLIKGLVDGKQLLEEDALAYIQEASTRPL